MNNLNKINKLIKELDAEVVFEREPIDTNGVPDYSGIVDMVVGDQSFTLSFWEHKEDASLRIEALTGESNIIMLKGYSLDEAIEEIKRNC